MQLHDSWSLWYDQTWDDRVVICPKIDTVQQAWAVLSSVPPPSELAPRSTLSLFRHGTQPSWEHPANLGGGRWAVDIQRRGGALRGREDKLWESLFAAIVGETIESAGAAAATSSSPPVPASSSLTTNSICVTGASVSVTHNGRRLRVSLWTRNAQHQELQRAIGSKLAEVVSTATSSLAAKSPENRPVERVVLRFRPHSAGRRSRGLQFPIEL